MARTNKELESTVFEKFNSYINKLKYRDKLTCNVYHYTKTDSNVISILKDRRLLMREYRDLREELKPTLNLLETKIFNRTLQCGNIKYDENTFTTIWEAFEYYRSKLRVFIASFSLSGDDPSLWRAFGERSNGFSIEVAKENFVETPQDRWPNINVMMKIYYGKDELEKFCEKISEALWLLERYPCYYRKGLPVLFCKIIPELPRFLPNEIPHRFANQQEYRLYAMDIGITKERQIPSSQIKEIEGKPRVYSEELLSENIVEILVGAKNNFESARTKIITGLNSCFSEERLYNIIKQSTPV